MGYAIVQAALDSGHEVTLISGPVNLMPPDKAKLIKVISAAEMAQAVRENAPSADVVIMCAAVADYRPAHPWESKLKKMPGKLVLELERTEDILGSLGKNKLPGQILVGFAAETDDLEENALGKLERKNLDWIAANLVSDGFGTVTNRITLYSRCGKKLPLPCGDKLSVAQAMLKEILP